MTDKARVEDGKNHVMNSLSSNTSSDNLRQNQKKAIKYFESLSKQEREKIIIKFEDEKVNNDLLKTIYKKE